MSAEFEGWAILELLGHRKLAGYVREATVAGAPMLRIDIPCEPPVTQYYAATALYETRCTRIATRRSHSLR